MGENQRLENGVLCTWTKEGLSSLFVRYSGRIDRPYRITIESLDGVCEPDHILGLMKRWGLVSPEATSPELTDPAEYERVLADEGVFPGYDTVWLAEVGDEPISPPDFMTWYASFGPGHLPHAKEGGEELSDWEPVGNWMRSNRIIFGLSQGFWGLAIEVDQSS